MDRGTGGWATHQAVRFPARVAFVDEETGRPTTYAQFDRLTCSAAAGLAELGVVGGDRVALVLHNGTAVFEVLFAVWRLGAIAVPVNWRLSASEIRYVLDDSGARVVFVSTDVRDKVETAGAGRGLRVVEVPDAQRRAAAGTPVMPLLGAPGPISTPVPAVDVALADPCVVMYTSGTTGRPKGAVLTHGNLLANAVHGFALADGLSSADVALTAAPLFHIGALGVHSLPLFYAGGTNVVMEQFDAVAWVEAIARWKVTLAFAVPVMWGRIEAAAREVVHDLTTVRSAMVGGAPASLALLERLRALGLRATEGYGLTEAAPIVAHLHPSDCVTHAGSVGRAAHLVEMRVTGLDGRPCPAGEVGELELRGPNVFVGYWNAPDATACALASGWFRTGDLVTLDAEQYLTIVGRRKDMIISGGENVYPAEVERALAAHPAVDEVAVVGVPDDTWGEQVVALVVPRESMQVEGSELVAWAREELAHFKCPRRVILVGALPHNDSGKVSKDGLMRLLAADARTGSGGVSGGRPSGHDGSVRRSAQAQLDVDQVLDVLP